jgi:hypothetical protein
MKIETWDIAETKQFETKPLQLLGAAVRKMMFFKPYVLAFYSVQKPISAQEAIHSEIARNIELIINSTMITGALLTLGLKEGLARSTFGSMPHLQPKFKEILSIFETTPIQVGDRFDLYYSESNELNVYHNSTLRYSETDADFIKAIFSIWFSDDFDREIRGALLGN